MKTAKEELARLRGEFDALLLSALQAQKAEILRQIKELESK